jgi:hypothetical protein
MYDVVPAEGLKAICLIPLVNRGRAIGMLGIGRTGESAFTPNDVEFLARVSGQIAIALENALAWEEISDLKDKLAQEKLYLEEDPQRDEFREHHRYQPGVKTCSGNGGNGCDQRFHDPVAWVRSEASTSRSFGSGRSHF